MCNLVRSSLLLYFAQKENWPDLSLCENITATWEATSSFPISIQYNDLRYVWIGALTIIKYDKEDWKTEADTPDESVHNVLAWPLGAGETPRAIESLREGEIYARRRWYNRANELPLAKRDWTLQKYLLSRCLSINYALNELICECRAGQAVESNPGWVGTVLECGKQICRGSATLSMPLRLSHWRSCRT